MHLFFLNTWMQKQGKQWMDGGNSSLSYPGFFSSTDDHRKACKPSITLSNGKQREAKFFLPPSLPSATT